MTLDRRRRTRHPSRPMARAGHAAWSLATMGSEPRSLRAALMSRRPVTLRHETAPALRYGSGHAHGLDSSNGLGQVLERPIQREIGQEIAAIDLGELGHRDTGRQRAAVHRLAQRGVVTPSRSATAATSAAASTSKASHVLRTSFMRLPAPAPASHSGRPRASKTRSTGRARRGRSRRGTKC